VLPDHLFVRLSLTEDEEQQNEEMLCPRVDPHNLREVDRVWWKEGWRVVTGDLAYWRQVVHDHHDLPAYGHPGISRTRALTERHYWWPRMRQEICDYVGGCADCVTFLLDVCPTWTRGVALVDLQRRSALRRNNRGIPDNKRV
jgi:hypothetical protein